MKKKSAGKRKQPVSPSFTKRRKGPEEEEVEKPNEQEAEPGLMEIINHDDIEDTAALYSEHESESESDPDTIEFLAQEDVEDTCAIFAEGESELEPEIIGFLAQGLDKQKRMVHFNDKAQPIGDGSQAFITQLGVLMRKHCPISYEHWWDVPDQTKDTIWKLLTDEYIVPVAYKHNVLDRVNTHWRRFKSILRSNHYDIYDTDEERKRNCPRGVKQDVWEIFVDNQSTPVAQARRKAGKLARQAVKTPHRFGRTGAAEVLKNGNPFATSTRKDSYVAMHPHNGSCPTPDSTHEVEEIKSILEQNPSTINLDVDRDPVAHVYAPEKKCFVRDTSVGVSETPIQDSASAFDIHPKRLFLRPDDEQIADNGEQAVSQGLAHIVDQLEEEMCEFSVEEQIALLDEQVVLQREQLELLQHERIARLSAEAQISELKKQLTSQGRMIQDLNELIKSRFS